MRSSSRCHRMRVVASGIFLAMSSGLFAPRSMMASTPGDPTDSPTRSYRVFQTLEYRGATTQFRLQHDSLNRWATHRAGDLGTYELHASGAVRFGGREPLGVALSAPFTVTRDSGTGRLAAPAGQPPLLARVMNAAAGGTGERARRSGTWEESIPLGLSPHLPERLAFTFTAAPVRQEGQPETMSVGFTGGPFTFTDLGQRGGGEVTWVVRGVFIYSPRADRLLQAGAVFSAVKGEEAVRIELLQYLCNEEGTSALAPAADLAELLWFAKSPLVVETEAAPPFWVLQATGAFEVSLMAGVAAGERATNSALDVFNQISDLMDASAELADRGGAKDLAKLLREASPGTYGQETFATFLGEENAKLALMGYSYVGAADMLVAAAAGAKTTAGAATVSTLGVVAAAATVAIAMPFGVYELGKIWEKEQVARWEGELAHQFDHDLPWMATPEEKALRARLLERAGGTAPARSWASQRASQLKTLVSNHPYVATAAGVGTVGLVAVAASGGGSGGGANDGGEGEGGSSRYRGSLSGSWWGKCPHYPGMNGGFSVSIDGGGRVSGSYRGADSGPITGSVDISGNLSAAAGSAGEFQWKGSVSRSGSSLSARGSWSGQGCNGGWEGSGSSR